jgi:raffinose/stachyose/melibiose transport system substrate-binding protein
MICSHLQFTKTQKGEFIMKGFNRLFVALLVAVFVLTSCAPKAAATEAPVATAAVAQSTEAATSAATEAATTAASGDQIHLTWWVDTSGDAATADCMIKQAADTFNATNTDNIYVEGVPQANAWDAIRTAVAGGGGPDIVYTPGPSYAYQMAQAGELYPLDDFATKFGWDKQFQPWALSLGMVNGKLYSIPDEIESMILYYNKTVFEKNGWTVPTTTDEWFDLMSKVKAAGLIANAAGNSEWKPTDEWYITVFLNEYAGSDNVYKALNGQIKWTDPVFVDAINKLNDAMTSGFWQNGLDRYYTAGSDEFLSNLGDGKAAMMVSGTWYLGQMDTYFGTKANNTNDWDWAPVPTKDGTAQYDLGIGSTYSINAASTNPEAAAKFLTYMYSSPIQSKIISVCGLAPAPVSISASDLGSIDARRVRLITELNTAAAAGQYGYTTWTFWPAKSDTYLYDEIEKVWAGSETTEQYLQGLQDTFDAELSAGSTLPIPTRK